jgi:hypothetical protein
MTIPFDPLFPVSLFVYYRVPPLLSTSKKYPSQILDVSRMAYYHDESSDWGLYNLHPLVFAQFEPAPDFAFHDAPAEYSPIASLMDNSSEYAPTSVNTPTNLIEEFQLVPSRKRQQSSESSQSDTNTRPIKTRRLRSPSETAKVRERGACFHCQKKRKEV